MNTSFLRGELFFSAISFLLSSLVVLFLKGMSVFAFVIILGQAHFLLGYLYKLMSPHNQKVAWKRFSVLTPTLLLFATYIYFNQNYLPHLIFVTLIIFVIHFSLDDAKMLGFLERKNKIYLVSLVTLSYLLLFLQKIYFVANVIIVPLLVAIVLLFIFVSIVMWRIRKSRVGQWEYYIVALFNVLFCSMALFVIPLSIYQISGFIILYHYLRWYIHYYGKLKGEELQYFIHISLSVNALFIFLAVMFTLLHSRGFLVTIFHPVYFYTWTLIHIFVTFNYNEVKLSR